MAKQNKTSRKATAKSKTSSKAAKPFDKYEYYQRAVQAPESDVVFFRDTYKSVRGELPTTLREDFCGTFRLSCEWTKLNPKFKAHGIDLDFEPIQYGRTNYESELTAAQRERLQIHQENVLNPGLPKADVIAAMNFSHFIFKDRAMMKSYFHNCLQTLNKNGIMIADAFGGAKCQTANEESTKHKGFTYFWDQVDFDPISNYANYAIHFKVDGEKKRENVFTYDWRMWTLPELREMMLEVGFKKTTVYWEGTTKKGEGDGNFKPSEKGEECEAWIAYVIGEK